MTINGEKQADPEYVFSDSDRLFGRYTLLRRGKKNYCQGVGNHALFLFRVVVRK